MNTTKKGTIRCIIFKEDNVWYGVGLEFNIVESGDDADVVMFNLHEAIRGYVESQKKIKGNRLAPLNQKADVEYESLWKNLVSPRPKPTPYGVLYFGVTRV